VRNQEELASRLVEAARRRAWGVPETAAGWRREWSVITRFAVPAFLASVVVGPVGWLANALLVNQPNGYAELGIFNAANQWRTTVLFLPTVLAQTSMPILTALLSPGSSHRVGRTLLATTIASVGVALPIAVALALLAGPVMGLYGPSFAPRGAVVVVIAATVVIMSLQLPIGQLIAAAGRMWLGAGLNLAWAIVFLGACVALVPTGRGADGLALAYLLGYAAHSVGTFAVGATLLTGTRARPPDEDAVSPAPVRPDMLGG